LSGLKQECDRFGLFVLWIFNILEFSCFIFLLIIKFKYQIILFVILFVIHIGLLTISFVLFQCHDANKKEKNFLFFRIDLGRTSCNVLVLLYWLYKQNPSSSVVEISPPLSPPTAIQTNNIQNNYLMTSKRERLNQMPELLNKYNAIHPKKYCSSSKPSHSTKLHDIEEEV